MELNRTDSTPTQAPLYYTNLQAQFSRAAVVNILRDLKKAKRKKRCLKKLLWAFFCLSMVGGIGTLAYFQINFQIRTSSNDYKANESGPGWEFQNL